MPITDSMLRSARSRKSSCVVPSKDCLSNSAAAADANAEQRFFSTVAAHERQRRKRKVSSSYGTTTTVFRERVEKGIKWEERIARKEVKEPLVPSGAFAYFWHCCQK